LRCFRGRTCEPLHIGFCSFRCRVRAAETHAMPEEPKKLIPDWLAVDLALIVASLTVIVLGIWIGV
jgi:hypothetical protein